MPLQTTGLFDGFPHKPRQGLCLSIARLIDTVAPTEAFVQVLILAGGRGIDLAPLSHDLPPSLLYLPGGSIMDYLLRLVEGFNPTNIAVVLQYRGDQLAEQLSQIAGVKLIPQNPPFTLLSALASAADWVEGPVLVFHGDYYFAARPEAFRAHDLTQPTFYVEESNTAPFYRSGAYWLPPEAFLVAQELRQKSSQTEFFGGLQRAGFTPHIRTLSEYAQHIHTPPNLLATHHFLLSRWHDVLHPASTSSGYDALNFNWIDSDAEIDRPVKGLFVTAGPRSIVKNCHLYNVLVMPDSRVSDVNSEDVIIRGISGTSKFSRLYGGKPFHPWLKKVKTQSDS